MHSPTPPAVPNERTVLLRAACTHLELARTAIGHAADLVEDGAPELAEQLHELHEGCHVLVEQLGEVQ